MRLAIIGGGIVGISVGLAAIAKGAEVTIYEKEISGGLHATMRNSGVLHSGVYYSSDSLKYSFSIQGNLELKQLCKDHNLGLIETGKLILSRDDETEGYLDSLEEKAIRNNVPYSRMDKRHIGNFEPRAKTHHSFLWVKSTAVGSPKDVYEILKKKFTDSGGKLVTGTKISEPSQLEELLSDKKSDMVINAAGSQAVRLARKLGLKTKLLTAPFLGIYWGVPSSELEISMPIYPTPHKVNPFLGVHLTPTASGLTKIGPTAIPVLGLEQYKLFSGFSADDTLESLRAMLRISLGDKHSLSSMIASEFPKFFKSKMVSEAANLHSGVHGKMGWRAIPGGIRAQLVDENGHLVQDFVVERQEKVVHILNAVSPGWTSALPFGRWIVENYIFMDSDRGKT